MLSFPAAIKVYLCTVPCDMRRSFDGLSMMAEHVIGCNPYAGHLLVFSNRRTDRVKILYWDRDEFTFRFNRRRSRVRGLLFYRLFQQAVQVGPVPYTRLVGGREDNNQKWQRERSG